jgi:hypothetical protein
LSLTTSERRTPSATDDDDVHDLGWGRAGPRRTGRGSQRFAGEANPVALNHVDHRTTGAGVNIDLYTSAGKPTFGSIGLEDEQR